jgi:hypothetical protein
LVAGGRRFHRRDARRHRAAQAVAEQEDPVDRVVLAEQADGGKCGWCVFVGSGEFGIAGHLGRVCVGDLVEAQHRHASAGQPPREVIEGVVPADRRHGRGLPNR